ncbi:MerR family transcriptional regulator [Gordonia sp. 4N]|uniref:MerR family transcriptional regulator n=1 Tax=Gordonia sp. 4N TaxID=2993508 RepID=UPI002249A1CA|nr:MerR family transcriptional regulator [Gordonia sp. 4N]MCX2754890.1 MerR family transcriptional regulator [Gordonia sp. 4N]
MPSVPEVSELVPIGAFAQRTGLTASALRFYDDSGLLTPAAVDASTGYRQYSASQERHAIALRRLREIGMSLADIRTVLAAEPGTAGGLIDEHVRTVAADADRVRREARTIKMSIAAESRTLCAADLRDGLSDLARGGVVVIDAVAGAVRFRLDGRDDLWCRLLDGPFPAHQVMIEALPTVTMRASVAKTAVLQSLERCATDRVHLDFTSAALTLSDASSAQLAIVPAETCGPPIALWFEVSTLYPAVHVSIGAEMMIDVRNRDLPMTIRSADGGDLTTVVMPVSHSRHND